MLKPSEPSSVEGIQDERLEVSKCTEPFRFSGLRPEAWCKIGLESLIPNFWVRRGYLNHRKPGDLTAIAEALQNL